MCVRGQLLDVGDGVARCLARTKSRRAYVHGVGAAIDGRLAAFQIFGRCEKLKGKHGRPVGPGGLLSFCARATSAASALSGSSRSRKCGQREASRTLNNPLRFPHARKLHQPTHPNYPHAQGGAFD